MYRSTGVRITVWLLAAVLILALAVPVSAAYTKFYAFMNYDDTAHNYARVILTGLETITAQWIDPWAWWPSDQGYMTYSGVFCTRLIFGSNSKSIAPGDIVWVKWSTSDSSCHLRDLSWCSSSGSFRASAYPQQISGCPGGGEIYVDPVTGDTIWIITNFTEAPIDLSSMQFAKIEGTLDGNDRVNTSCIGLRHGIIPNNNGSAPLLDGGIVVRLVEEIDAMIEALRQEIVQAEEDDLIRHGLARSLTRKLDHAVSFKERGLESYQAGHERLAKLRWWLAAVQMHAAISILKRATRGRQGAPEDLVARWIAMAEEIRDALLELPGTPAQELEPPAVTPCAPAMPPDSPPLTYTQWPLTELPAASYTAFVVDSGTSNDGPAIVVPASEYAVPAPTTYVLEGQLGGGPGEPMLQWMEEATAPPAGTVPDTTPPQITSATITPSSLRPSEEIMTPMALDVSVNEPGATWYIQGVTASEEIPEEYVGWELDPFDNQALSLQGAAPDGNGLVNVADATVSPATGYQGGYTVTVGAIDLANNTSSYDVDVALFSPPADAIYGSGQQISSLAAIPTRGSGAQLTFTLAADGVVEAQVLNIAGRVVKTINPAAECDKGTNTMMWNGRNNHGAYVPAGRYLIRLNAKTADGTQASAVCPVQIQR